MDHCCWHRQQRRSQSYADFFPRPAQPSQASAAVVGAQRASSFNRCCGSFVHSFIFTMVASFRPALPALFSSLLLRFEPTISPTAYTIAQRLGPLPWMLPSLSPILGAPMMSMCVGCLGRLAFAVHVRVMHTTPTFLIIFFVYRGRWRCDPQCSCQYKYRFGDYAPGRSCRLKPDGERGLTTCDPERGNDVSLLEK